MTLRFGTVGSPSTSSGGTPGAIETIHQLGLDALELGWVRSVRINDDTAREIAALAQENGVFLSVHAPYYINLNSQTADKMKASDERLLTAAQKGYLSGAKDIIFHPGSYHKQPPDEVYGRARDHLGGLADKLRKEGVQVTLRPETMGKGAMFGSLEEVVGLAKEIEGVSPCIDVAHLHARPGDGSFNSYEEFASMFRLVERDLGREGLNTMHFHISGIEYTEAGEQNHLMLEESDLDWRAFIQACVDFEVSGTVVTESPTQEDDARLLQGLYRELSG